MKGFLAGCRIYLIAGLLCPAIVSGQSIAYMWLESYDNDQSIEARIKTPEGYQRVSVLSGSFADWLRHLPLKKDRSPVRLYNGREKFNQGAHHAVIDIDVGDKNLQQCADAVIRLWAEYLYFVGAHDAIHFKFTSGHEAQFTKWVKGYRPRVSGNRVWWRKVSQEDSSYASFKRYLETVFIYAGSYSLSREMTAVENASHMQIGDVFIQGGFPGHAVIVVDMAVNRKTGKKVFMIAQSYMPAQDIHILKNPADSNISPWYELDFGDNLQTPEWTFTRNDIKRFQGIDSK